MMMILVQIVKVEVFFVFLVQDDFLPRTPTPLEDIFKSIFWLVLPLL